MLPKREIFLGESFVVELRLYLNAGVRRIDGYQPPALTGDGFSAGPWKQGQNFQRRVGGRVFTVLPVMCPVTPVKTGPIHFAPLNATVLLNPPDMFEGFLAGVRTRNRWPWRWANKPSPSCRCPPPTNRRASPARSASFR